MTTQHPITDLRDTLNRPLRDLRLSITDKCNLRCSYCMPELEYGESYKFLANTELLSYEEFTRLAKIFIDLGVEKIRLTGGEPLLRKDLPALVKQLVELDSIDDIAMTTNGMLLAEKAQALFDAGLHRLTVSLDSLDHDACQHMNGRRMDPEVVLQAIETAQEVGFDSIKINTVVKRGANDHTIIDLLRQFRNTSTIVRFIEFMDVGTRNEWKLDDVVSARELHDMIHKEFPLIPLDKNYTSEVASRYAYEDGSGEIGFITSVTNTFCGDCSRARISANGQFHTCLFATQGTDLKTPMRDGASDEELCQLIASVWNARSDRYSELRASMTHYDQKPDKVEMYQMGG